MTMTKRLITATGLWMFGLAVVVACMGSGVSAALTCTTNDASTTQAGADLMVNYIRQIGAQGATGQCCNNEAGILCDGIDNYMCSDLYPQQSTSDLTRALMCGACGGCTSCTTAGNALNDVLAQCILSIDDIARVGGSEDAEGYTFRIITFGGSS